MGSVLQAFLARVLSLPRGVLILFGVMVVVLLLIGSGKVFADDDPPESVLSICTGGLPVESLQGSAQFGCHDVQISATEVEDARLIGYEPQAFSHEYFVSGDPGCIFTAEPRTMNTPKPETASGGRDFRPGESQVAYIAEGWHTYAITGQSCQQAGIPLCGGLYCT